MVTYKPAEGKVGKANAVKNLDISSGEKDSIQHRWHRPSECNAQNLTPPCFVLAKYRLIVCKRLSFPVDMRDLYNLKTPRDRE